MHQRDGGVPFACAVYPRACVHRARSVRSVRLAPLLLGLWVRRCPLRTVSVAYVLRHLGCEVNLAAPWALASRHRHRVPVAPVRLVP